MLSLRISVWPPGPSSVWVNCHHLIDPALPFGGFKQTGISREQAAYGIELYTEKNPF